MAEDPTTAPEPEPESEPAPDPVPFLRVVKGDPRPEELAALVGVLWSLGGPEVPATPPRPEWNAPHRQHRVVHPHGPGGWWASAHPR
jgi:hypothetical protein